jgi:hypothetical protein
MDTHPLEDIITSNTIIDIKHGHTSSGGYYNNTSNTIIDIKHGHTFSGGYYNISNSVQVY